VATIVLKVPIDDDGQVVEVEVDSGNLDIGMREQLLAAEPDLAKAAFSLASSVDRITPALSTVLHRLRAAEHVPDEIGVELGLKVGGETGLIIAKGTADATFKVTLAWKRPNGDRAAEPAQALPGDVDAPAAG
jgi:hypothetical protein